MAARYGLVSDLSPSERRAMVKFNRGLAVTRVKTRAKKAVEKHHDKVLLGLALAGLVAVFVLKKRAVTPTP